MRQHARVFGNREGGQLSWSLRPQVLHSGTEGLHPTAPSLRQLPQHLCLSLLWQRWIPGCHYNRLSTSLLQDLCTCCSCCLEHFLTGSSYLTSSSDVTSSDRPLPTSHSTQPTPRPSGHRLLLSFAFQFPCSSSVCLPGLRAARQRGPGDSGAPACPSRPTGNSAEPAKLANGSALKQRQSGCCSVSHSSHGSPTRPKPSRRGRFRLRWATKSKRRPRS